MKIIPMKGFELYEEFMNQVYDFFNENDLTHNSVTQEQSGNQKFIKIELSIKVE